MGVSSSPPTPSPQRRAPPLPPIPGRFPRAFFGVCCGGGVGAGRGGFWVVPGGVPGVTPWGTHSSTPAFTRRVMHSLAQGVTRGVMPGLTPRGTPSITPEDYGRVRFTQVIGYAVGVAGKSGHKSASPLQAAIVRGGVVTSCGCQVEDCESSWVSAAVAACATARSLRARRARRRTVSTWRPKCAAVWVQECPSSSWKVRIASRSAAFLVSHSSRGSDV